MRQKQVDKGHYAFAAYMSKARWTSIWHQLDEVARLGARHLLEIGPGPGTFKALAAQFDVVVETVDLDPELKPDHVAAATHLPFEDGQFDLACAFQVLEHMPYEDSLLALDEMLRVSRLGVVISLPDAKRAWYYRLHVPVLGSMHFLVPVPRLRPAQHVFDGEHHWEIGKRGYTLDRILRDFSARCVVDKTFRVPENPYHRFFVLRPVVARG